MTQLTKEHRQKLSDALKLAHKEHRHPGWQHINSDINRRSYPERFFLHGLTESSLTDRFTFIEKLPIGKYFLDFALIDLKIDIEIDGEQHFKTVSALEHDRNRDNFLIANGWKIYRISWYELKNNPKETFNNLISYLDNIKTLTNRYYEISDVKLKRKNLAKFGNREDYSKAKKELWYDKEKSKIDLVLNSEIDFSKSGWVTKVSLIIDKPPQKVKSWMLRMMPAFYEEYCFKRKLPL